MTDKLPLPQPESDVPPPYPGEVCKMADKQQHPQPVLGVPPPCPQNQFQVPPPQNITRPVFVAAISFGENPVRMVCPNCRKEIVTETELETSSTQHLAFLLCCLICPCFSCLPYCMDSLANVQHECPSCRTHLGTYRR